MKLSALHLTLSQPSLLCYIVLTLSHSCFFFSVQAQSCHHSIEGTIYDHATKQPLPYATVKIKGTTKGAVSDENGHFKVENLCDKDGDVVCSCLGYKEKTHHHHSYHDLPTKIYLAPEDLTLESVVVEGSQTTGDLVSGTVSALSSKDLQEYRTESLADLAAQVSGVSVLQTGQNVVKPVIHGLHSNRVLIMNNGVRHEFQNWGADHAPEIDASLIHQLKVIKGAATVRYGPDALGGVILVDAPEMDLLTPFRGHITLTGKSNGRSGEGTMEFSKGFQRAALMAQASWVRQGDLHAPRYMLTNTGKNEKSVVLGARYHFHNLDFQLYYSHFDQTLGILRSTVTGSLDDLVYAMESKIPPITHPFSYKIRNPHQTVRHTLYKLHGQWHGDNQSIDMQYAFQVNQRKEFDVRRGTNNALPMIDLELHTQTFDLNWNHKPFGKWSGGLGLQTLYQANTNLPGTNTIPFVPNYYNLRLGLYWIETGQFSEQDWLEFGIRYDYQNAEARGRNYNNDLYRNRTDYNNVSLTVGYKREISANETFQTNIGTAWRPPNISELYRFGRHNAYIDFGLWRYQRDENNRVDTRKVLSEKDKPVPSEKGFKWVTSYRYKNEVWDTEVTVYANYMAHYIYNRPGGITTTVQGAFPFFLYVQTNALFVGADWSARVQHHNNWYSKIRANYLWAQDVKHNARLVSIPPPNLTYGIYYTRRNWGALSGVTIGMRLSYFFEQHRAPRVITVRRLLDAKRQNRSLFAQNQRVFDFLPAPQGYVLAGLSAAADWKSFAFLFKVDNLFNTAYRNYMDRLRYFADEPGINFTFSVKYNF